MSTQFEQLLTTLARGRVRFVLVKLIALKRAAGRPRDFEAIAELEALLDEQGEADAGGYSR